MPWPAWIRRLFGTDPEAIPYEARETVIPPEVDLPALPAVGEEFQGRYRYKLSRLLGRGAAGAVYLAEVLDPVDHDPQPPRQVALKLLHPSGDAEGAAQDLKRELSALLAIETDRVPKVYDWSPGPGFPFVAMQYFGHGSLRNVLRAGARLKESRVWTLLEDLLTALQHAHQASVLHLDIKPANVLRDRTGGFVLTDFGISQGSRMFRGPLRTVGLGTPGYQAPEQRWGQTEDFDLRTDLYSVGATAWTACLGIHLATRDAQRILAKDASETWGLPRLDGLRPDLSPALVEVVMNLLYQDPEKRPGSAADALRQVRAAQEGLEFQDLIGGERVPEERVQEVLTGLIDPLWTHIFKPGSAVDLRRFQDGQVLAEEGESSFECYILLRGEVRVSRGGQTLASLSREGTFLGEIAALTGCTRTATMTACGPVYVYVLNTAQLEQFVTSHPPVGVRLIRAMAERMARDAGS